MWGLRLRVCGLVGGLPLGAKSEATENGEEELDKKGAALGMDPPMGIGRFMVYTYMHI